MNHWSSDLSRTLWKSAPFRGAVGPQAPLGPRCQELPWARGNMGSRGPVPRHGVRPAPATCSHADSGWGISAVVCPWPGAPLCAELTWSPDLLPGSESPPSGVGSEVTPHDCLSPLLSAVGTQGTWLCGLRNVETPKRSEKWHLGKCQSSEEVLGREAPPPRKVNREGEPGSDSSFRARGGGGGGGQLKAWAQSRPRKGRSPAGPGTALPLCPVQQAVWPSSGPNTARSLLDRHS